MKHFLTLPQTPLGQPNKMCRFTMCVTCFTSFRIWCVLKSLMEVTKDKQKIYYSTSLEIVTLVEVVPTKQFTKKSLQ